MTEPSTASSAEERSARSSISSARTAFLPTARSATRRSVAASTSDVPVAEELFPIHSTVRHQEWGPGMVLGYEDDKMTVLFDSVGYKTLSVKVVSKQKLLIPAES